MVDEARFPHLFIAALEGVAVGLGFAAQDEAADVRLVDVVFAVVDEFRITEADDGAALPPDPDARPAGDRLADIVNYAAGTAFEFARRSESPCHPAGRHDLFGEDAAGTRDDFRLLPGRVVETVFGPARNLLPGIVEFAVAELGARDRPRFAQAFPALVGAEGDFAVDFEFEDQLLIVVPRHFVEVPDFGGQQVVPAGAENDAEGVRAFPEPAAEIVLYIPGAAVVLGDDGVEHMVADLFAVQVKFIIAESAQIDDGFAAAVPFERPAEIRCGPGRSLPVVETETGGNPIRTPFSLDIARNHDSIPVIEG